MTIIAFSLSLSLYIRHNLPRQCGDYSDTKKVSQSDTVNMYRSEQRAYDSPEPEGSKMVSYHSKDYAIIKKIFCKAKKSHQHY
jgi:hypothetical protein